MNLTFGDFQCASCFVKLFPFPYVSIYEDVQYVLARLPSSAPGPDGVPFFAFASFRELLRPIFHEICQGMLDGTVATPDDFNLAF